MTTKERILLESKAWREEKLDLDSQYFVRLNKLHGPKILWITSTDSLASVREMTNTDPGDIIIYGNLASQVSTDDASLMAVIEQAVEVHQVTQIIICGYSNCEGVRYVLDRKQGPDSVERWLERLRTLYDKNFESLKTLSREEQEKILSELNIREQVINLSRVACVQKAWGKRDYPEIHGWYLDLGSGTLQEVYSLEKNHRLKQLTTLSPEASRIKITAS